MDNQFKVIDPILDQWLSKHGLTVFKKYKEYEVRSISVIDDQGVNCHIWIDAIENGFFINAAESDNQFKLKSSFDNFSNDMDFVYSIVCDWINEKGNTRGNYIS